DFESATGKYFREKVQAPFFAHYLKDRGKLDLPEALSFRTGANRWESYPEWPPRHATERSLYFRAGGRLAFDPSDRDSGGEFDSSLSDPAHPVPYRNRPIEPTYFRGGSGWPTWLVEDQRNVHLRPDVLAWETEPLGESVVVAGDVLADLFASTSGTDS